MIPSFGFGHKQEATRGSRHRYERSILATTPKRPRPQTRSASGRAHLFSSAPRSFGWSHRVVPRETWLGPHLAGQETPKHSANPMHLRWQHEELFFASSGRRATPPKGIQSSLKKEVALGKRRKTTFLPHQMALPGGRSIERSGPSQPLFVSKKALPFRPPSPVQLAHLRVLDQTR